MAALPALRQMAIEAIGEALSKEDIVRIVKAATGNDVFNIYADERDPRAVALSKTLKQLETEGTERWLLTYILIAIAQQQRLRMLIVKTWPGTLVGLPLAVGQVDNTLKHLRALLNIPLSINLRQELKPKHEPFDEIRRRITELYAYKSLHELLHVLNVKLAAAESAPAGGTQDFNAILAQCDAIATQAALVVTQLDSLAGELAWISELTGLASSLRTAIQASNNNACATARGDIEGMVRLRLMWLNGQVFKTANELPFEPLVYDYPLDIVTKAGFGEFVHSVRDLKPTIIARALKQSMWQEVENEISLISDLINIPGDDFSEFSKHWHALKLRVLWLATLDPDDGWMTLVQQTSDEIDDRLSGEHLDDETRRSFEAYRNMLRLRFLAIDNPFKEDCISLRLIDPPLTEILKELMQ